MIPGDHDEYQASNSGTGHHDESPAPEAHREVVATTDPAVAAGRLGDRPEGIRPDETIVAETSHVTGSTGYAGPPQVGPSASEKSREVGRIGRDEGPSEGQGGDHRGSRSRPAESNRPSWIRYALTGLVALVCGVGGAWAYSQLASSKDKDPSAGGDQAKRTKKADDGTSSREGSSDSQAKGNDEASSGGSGSMSRGEAPAGNGDNLSNQVRNLSAGFEALRQRLESMSMPRDSSPPDLASLRIRMDELSRKVDDVKGLSSRDQEISERLDRLQEEVKGLRDRFVADRERGGHEASPPIMAVPRPKIEAPAAPVPVVNPSSSDEALSEGMALFKKEKYPQAEAIFRLLQQTKPQDARVWYYSALANGLATGQWQGEARSFVMQGAERERAGLPATSVIDSAFADLKPASGKDWLASYRSQLVKQ